MKKLAELVFIPSPGMGHLASTVEIAKLLIDRDDRLFITVLIMNLPGLTDLDSYTKSLVDFERIKFVDLSKINGYDPSSVETNPGMYKSAFIESHKPYVRKVVEELLQSSELSPARNSPRLAGFVIDMFCTTMIDVANEFGVPTYVFYTSGAAFLGLMFHIQALYDDNNVDLIEFKDDPDTELVVPSFVEPVPISSLPNVLLFKGWSPLLIHHTRKIREAKGIIVNSFMGLESHAVRSISDGKLPPVYPVGPILNLSGWTKTNSQISNIMEWLNGQPPLSVVFLCFGSMGCFSEDQVKEIAYALDQSGLRFLWSLRKPPPKGHQMVTYASPSDYEDPSKVLPAGFLDRTVERGKVIGWVPQVDILSHAAIGGFVSHCGWNSTLESIWFGVPTASWPLLAEQHLNGFQMVKELGLAVEMKLDYKSTFYWENKPSLVKAQEIEGVIRRLMEPHNDMRKRVKEMSEKSRKAIMDGGTSHSYLGRLISDVIDNI